MILRFRRLVVLATVFAVIAPAAGQALSVLHIKVVLVDADRKATPTVYQGEFLFNSAPSRRTSS